MENKYQEYPYRFVMISVYLIASLVNSIPMNTFSATATLVKKNFQQIPHIAVSLFYLIGPISHAILAIPINWMLTKKGIRFSYSIGSVAMITGVWLRTTLSNNNPYLCLLGSFLSGGSGLVVMNSASKITMYWFRDQIFPLATFATVLSTFISIGAGLFLPSLLVNSSSTADDMIHFLRFQAILITIPFVFLIILTRQKPKTPPSKSAEKQLQNNKEIKYKQSMKLLFKNRNYIKLTASMSLTFGIMVANLSILDNGLKTLGKSEPGHTIAIISLSALLSGIVGTLFYSIMVKRTKKFKLFSIIQTFGVFIGYAILQLGIFFDLQQTYQIALMSLIFGFNYFSQPSLFVLYGVQIAFPVDQASIAGYLIIIPQTFGFIVGLIMVNLVTDEKSTVIILFSVLGIIMLIGAILSLIVEEDLRKMRFQTPLLNNYVPEEDQTPNSTEIIAQQTRIND